ncbi:proteoglycan 3-like [Pyxicephalus adspersus]|uniref:proteoglycan 3-like n=1 Tax=Pyxicephalus adspersus TaxID=30357 RepID=UPI003B5AB0FB
MKIVDEKTKIFGVLRIFTRVVRTFFRAENVCRRLHGDLSSIHGRRISARMRRMMKKRGGKKLAWIGVWRPWRSGKYQNVDQTPMDYSRFGRGQCKKRGRWCVAMNMQTGRWTSQNCNRKLPFVCKSCQRP